MKGLVGGQNGDAIRHVLQQVKSKAQHQVHRCGDDTAQANFEGHGGRINGGL